MSESMWSVRVSVRCETLNERVLGPTDAPLDQTLYEHPSQILTKICNYEQYLLKWLNRWDSFLSIMLINDNVSR